MENRREEVFIENPEERIMNRKEDVNMFLFLTGKLVSLLGSNIYNFAIGLYVLKVTGSGMNFAMTLALGVLPRVVLGPFAGTFADRFDRKKMVIGMDLISGLMLVIIYLFSLHFGLLLGMIYLSNFLLATFNTFFGVSFVSSIANIVRDHKLVKINSYNESVTSLSNILGPVLGGIIYGFIGIELFVLFNGLSFILSGISEMFIDFKFNKGKKEISSRRTKILQEMKEGFQYLRSQKTIYNLSKYILFINYFFSGLSVALSYIIVNQLGLSSEQLGVIQGSSAVGALIFSIVLSIMPEIKNKHKVMVFSLAIMGLLVIAVALPITTILSEMNDLFYMVYYMAIGFTIGGFVVTINVPLNVVRQRIIPDHFRGRVFGVLETLAMAIMPLGYMINGALMDFLPSYMVPLFSGILILVVVEMMRRDQIIKDL